MHRSILSATATLLCLSLAACGGGGEDQSTDGGPTSETAHATSTAARSKTTPAPPTGNTLLVAITIPGYPHKVDVYRPAGATRAVVFLHGLGGRTGEFANELGLNKTITPPTMSNVDWDWLSRNGIIAVFPQGQNKPGTKVSAWSDYLQTSGQDDVGFLKALSSYVRSNYGATQVSLAGHSNGGAMTARMWCEATTSYKTFFSMAGPMPSPSYPAQGATCTPLAPAPYYVVIGGKDTTLQIYTLGLSFSTPEQIAVGLDNLILTSEWDRHADRSRSVCGETPVLEVANFNATGETWSSCNSQVRYQVVTNAEHPIASLEQYAGVKMIDTIAAFAR